MRGSQTLTGTGPASVRELARSRGATRTRDGRHLDSATNGAINGAINGALE